MIFIHTFAISFLLYRRPFGPGQKLFFDSRLCEDEVVKGGKVHKRGRFGFAPPA